MLGSIVKFILAALVLLFVGLLVPGFRVDGVLPALGAAVVIVLLGRMVQALLGPKVSPQGRGLGSFLTAGLVIYLTQFVVPGIHANMVGALLAALVIGIIDAFIPIELR